MQGTLDFSSEEAAAVVERTFEEADLNKDDKIDFSEYCRSACQTREFDIIIVQT